MSAKDELKKAAKEYKEAEAARRASSHRDDANARGPRAGGR
ncbi:hypothetical protein [Streptomyces fuscigenes]|nr:hypothetical protein [Streptomyces fuscigenes]